MIFITSNIGLVYGESRESQYERAVVIHATDLMSDPEGEFESLQYVSLKISSGKYKGQLFESKNIISGRFIFDFPVEEGDKVIVFVDEKDDEIAVHIADYR